MENLKYYELCKEFDKIKDLNSPFIYIGNFFSNLRCEIDLAFGKKKKQINTDYQKQLLENWTDMLNKVNKIEKDLFQNQTTNPISEAELAETTLKIHMIENKLEELRILLEKLSNEKGKQIDPNTNEALVKKKELLFDIEYSIERLKNKMEKLLFANKTIIFLEKNKCQNKEIFNELNDETTVGKLILIKNEYFSQSSISVIKMPFTTANFTNESLKCHELKDELEKCFKKDQIIETPLNVSKLTKIKLSNNKLKDIASNIFHGLTNLTYIDLNRNQLTYIEPHLFKGLNNLSEVDLSDNCFTNLNPKIFNNLMNLKEIYLNSNKIVNVNKILFFGLINLTKINLSHNLIETLDPKVFDGLKNLADIDLSYNKLKALDSKLFNRLGKLEVINLEHNELECLDKYLFRSLTNLRTIRLNSNQLTTLDVSLFSDLTNFTQIYLYDNYTLLDNINVNKFSKYAIHW